MRRLGGVRHGVDAHGRARTGLGLTIPVKIPVRYHFDK
ncbi:hypothetical protein AZ78_2857 [Lysobacter capsici AZ78]|uniref:Uncharacterized protein n=1 Tax=Lysobacter capsici AZ78 TaxID=1444315 RepID=A0A108UA15_9GAMM|nr:hypothetical protein AZ78_2857 [Lysobacter capsici AZ78]